MSPTDRPARRDTVGRILLALAATSAAAAAIGGIADIANSGSDQAMLAAWRAFGLPVFAGIFALLAWRPRAYRGIFELAIAHKLALTGYALVNLDVPDAGTVLVADGTLTLALVVAYVLTGARLAWTPAVETVPDATPQPGRT